MKKIILNISLNVGLSEPDLQKEKSIKAIIDTFSPDKLSYKLSLEEWKEGDKNFSERVLSIKIYTLKNIEIQSKLSRVAKLLSQDAIVYLENKEYFLVFSDNYTGLKYAPDKSKFVH